VSSDRFDFERPWAVAAVKLAAAIALPFTPWAGAALGGVLLGLALVLLVSATGLRQRGVLIGIFAGGALAGLILPKLLSWTVILALGGLAAAALVLLRMMYPSIPHRIRNGQEYRFGDTTHRMPELRHEGRPGFLLRPSVARDLIDLAAYSSAFLDRLGIGHVMMYGTLLGAVRHQGLIPWDDDVDFVLYRAEDIARLDREFEMLAAEVARDGYVLVRHNAYWKIAKPGFWRYPWVDLYCDTGLLGPDETPVRIPWEGLELPAPPDTDKVLNRFFGPDSLQHSILDLAFWDSGFVPAATLRLFGANLLNKAEILYAALFAPKAK